MNKRHTPVGPPDFAALAPGPFTLLDSHRPSEQSGVLLERYLYAPGERRDVSLDWHLLVLLRSASNRGVLAEPGGEWVPFANTRGAIAVLPAGCGPAVRLATSCDVTVYGFAPTVLNTFRDELAGPRPPELNPIAATRDGDLLALLHLLDRELGLGEPSGRLYAESLAFALLARAVALSSHRAGALSFDASPLSVRAQKRLFEFIEENLHRNLSLEDLSRQVGYGRGHFLRTFRAAAGTSPHQYLLDRRVERAKAMLKKTRTPLVEIATACGFSSQSHFSTEFRRRVGISPGHFRRSR
jgi:AraC family transcriptional regulator